MINFRPATPKDIPIIEDLLSRVNLPTNEVDPQKHAFFVGEEDRKVVVTAGLEVFGKSGLLRSVAVAPELQSKGLGGQMYKFVMEKIRATDLREVWLLTTTAEKFFGKLGFEKRKREEAPPDIQNSWQFEHGACHSASVMCYLLS